MLSGSSSGRSARCWQIIFADGHPANQMDVLASAMARSSDLDLALLKHGVYVLPNVRRFVSAVHEETDFAATLEALDGACAAIAARG